MASTRDIRRRIKSVKNTRQITKAMELVAASKMKKAQQAALASRPYAQLLANILMALAPNTNEQFHPFLVRRTVKTRGILLITSDKGLCGPLNSNLFKIVTEIQIPAKFYSVGRKGTQFLARTKRDLIADFPVQDRAPFSEVKVAIDFIVKQYLEGIIDTIEIIYPRFKNTLVQEPVIRPVLPLDNLRQFIESVQRHAGNVAAEEINRQRLFHFEPSVESVLNALLPFYVHREIYQFVLSARASEQSARMVAMKTAKDNATKLVGELTLEYNKARQAAITQEILEIAASSFSNA